MESSTKRSPYELLPNILDQLAHDGPDKLYAELPISLTDFTDGFRHITYGVLANAVNGVAWWLTETLGPGRGSPTLALLDQIILATIFSFSGLSRQGQASKGIGLQHYIDLVDNHPDVPKIAEEHGNLQVHQVPDTASFFNGKHQPFPYTKSFEQAHDEPLVAASFALQRYLEPPEGFESLDALILGNRVLSLMPQFHAAHLFVGILFTFYCDIVCILPPALAPLTADIAVSGSQHTQVDAVTVVPPHIEQFGSNPELVDNLVKNGVRTLFWAGGPVSEENAMAIGSRINLFNTAGSTEMGMWPVIRKSEPWDSSICRDMCFHPQANIVFREDSDGLFRAVVPVFHILKDDDNDAIEFDSGDLSTRVSEPGKVHRWTYYGRSDDMQVFQSGMKWHPTVSERKIVSENLDLVKEALLNGIKRAHVVLLLELVPAISTELSAVSESEQDAKREHILDRI